MDFTSEAIDYLSKFGITSYQVVGSCKDNQYLGHSWVGIDFFGTILNFEPQSLVIFNPNDEYIPELKIEKTVARPVDFKNNISRWIWYIRASNKRMEAERLKAEEKANLVLSSN